LELWATSARYSGGNVSGYKLAYGTLGQLSAGYYFYSIDGTVSLRTTPPSGTWYLTMFVTEYTNASSNDGYTLRDFGNFTNTWSIGGATNSTKVTVYELYNTITNHYFRTSSADEVAGIASGSAGPGWTRTNDDFPAFTAQSTAAGSDVCRFYSKKSNSHFYTASNDECVNLKTNGGEWGFEGLSFRVQLPSNGICESGLSPIYRLYNDRFSFTDSNHRFTSIFSEVDRLTTASNPAWKYEGVAFCIAKN
jgi:hypothetical protein